MSATICWEPTNKTSKRLDVGAPQSFMSMLEAAGIGNVVGIDSLPILRGMIAAAQGGGESKALQQLHAAVEKHGEIRWWPEY